MGIDSLMNWIHLFRLHWPYEKPRILLNYVDHMTLRCHGRSFSLTEVINDLVLDYNTIQFNIVKSYMIIVYYLVKIIV